MINGEKKIARPFRWGIVGGGRTSQVGYKHRLGAMMDNTNFELVAAAFDIDPERCVDFGRELNMDPARCYPDYKTLFAEDAKNRGDEETIKNTIYPDIDAGIDGIRWINACAESADKGSVWTKF